MNIEIIPSSKDEITPLRELHRQQTNCQIMHDSFLRRDFTDPYLIQVEGRTAGYGLVAHKHWPETVHEMYLMSPYEAVAQPIFQRLLDTSGAKRILAQTNNPLMLLMLYDFAEKITSDTILFDDAFTSNLTCPSVELKPITDADKERLKEQKMDEDAHWMLEFEGIPIATGGFLTHYNPPYGDIYMGVNENYRRRGFGSYMVQEMKRVAYEAGRKPAARCNVSNVASRRTMQKAGLLPCARLLEGEVVKR